MTDGIPVTTFAQLRAMLARNLLLKRRTKAKTIGEIVVPLYFLGFLALICTLLPSPAILASTKESGEIPIDFQFSFLKPANRSYALYVVPDTEEVRNFTAQMNETWVKSGKFPHFDPSFHTGLDFVYLKDEKELEQYNTMNDNDNPVHLAIVFDADPLTNMYYTIRNNDIRAPIPSVKDLYDAGGSCRDEAQWSQPFSVVYPLEFGYTCPINNYYYSDFLAVQSIVEATWLQMQMGDSTDTDDKAYLKHLNMQLFPKPRFVDDTALSVKRFLVPLYMVMTLSQFIVSLLTLIVGEKEKKIKEGLRMMGLKDSIYWLSWYLPYFVFILVLSGITTGVLVGIDVIVKSSTGLVFLLIFLYGLSVISLAFLITPFFSRAKVAGIFGSLVTTFLNLFYYIQVATGDSTPTFVYWILGLISPTGFALGMDRLLEMEAHTEEGLTLATIWHGPGLPFAGSLIMVTLDVLLYMLIAYYLDNVLPSEYGSQQSPLFCFKRSFWFKRELRLGVENDGYDGSLFNDDIEPIPMSLRGKEAVKIRGLTKTFKAFRKPPFQAVKGLSMDIYEGQITAILGHNGAGKTTLFNILTGMTDATSGSAHIYGLDISDSNEMQNVRRMTGVCPQHDVLFDQLTPREHLVFFARIRGVPEHSIEAEIDKTLGDIDLVNKADTPSAKLSGGQKRKLSIGIALIGDPKIVFLDEPTAGVDPYSRRHLWKLLQQRKAGKVILLTTHFMDEADLLADRKVVVTKGKLRCMGSSLFLKNKFGVGYHLTFVLNDNFKEVEAIRSLVEKHVPDTTMNRHFGRELSYVLPREHVSSFPALFTKLEDLVEHGEASEIGFNSYGVSMTTLEEVFLKIGEEAEMESHKERNGGLETTPEKEKAEVQSTWNELNELDIPIMKKNRKLRTFLTIVKLRWLTLLREPMAVFFQVFMPTAFAALSIYLGTLQTPPDTPTKTLFSPEMYPDILNSPLLYNSQGSSRNMSLFWENLSHSVNTTLEDYNGDYGHILDLLPRWMAIDTEDYLNITEVGNRPYKHTRLRFNDSMYHLPPIAINTISNTILKEKCPDKKISLSVYPLPLSEKKNYFDAGQFTSAMFIGIIFVLAPSGLVAEIVHDREHHLKNLLRVNGLTFGLYFSSFFAVLGTLMVVTVILIIILIIAYQLSSLTASAAIGILIVLYLLYVPVSLTFATCASYLFKTMETAQSIFPNISILAGLIPYIIVMVCDMFQFGGSTDLAEGLHIGFCFVDVLYLPYAILYYINRSYFQCIIKASQQATSEEDVFATCTNQPLKAYMTVEIWIIPLAMAFNFVFYFFLLAIIDVKQSGGLAADAFPFLKYLGVGQATVDEEAHVEVLPSAGDSDVQAEALRVKHLLQNPPATNRPVVLISGLHKKYGSAGKKKRLCCLKKEPEKTKAAINSLSFAVEAGEVFGLLGHNGAGKTSTMKVITAEESPTYGRVQVAGHEIISNQSEAFQALGYCPQHDALWRNITVREHLEAYAIIRGIEPSHINRVIELYMHGLQIEEHASKYAKDCSGGTRRKLSYALSMLGHPSIVLMDEPSTGMDPHSKRFLWNTISASFQGKRGAILTTHSMEEADALCSRLGIMVKGEMRCLGTGQHLKNRYGSGYLIELKLKSLASESSDRLAEQKANADRIRRINSLFPSAVVQESFEDRVIFSVAQESIISLAHTFESLEKVREELRIEEYSFSQTTLEQVFLKFAHVQEEDDSDNDSERGGVKM